MKKKKPIKLATDKQIKFLVKYLAMYEYDASQTTFKMASNLISEKVREWKSAETPIPTSPTVNETDRIQAERAKRARERLRASNGNAGRWV